MIGVQFNDIGQDSTAISKYGTLSSNLSGYQDDNYNFLQTLKVWNGRTYTFYGWAGVGPSTVDGDEYAYQDNTWLNYLTADDTEDMTQVGKGAWIITDSAGTITMQGEVPTNDTITINLVAGYNMVSFPYPVESTVADFCKLSSNLLGYQDDNYNFLQTMKVWTGRTYAFYGWAGVGPSTVDGDEYAYQDNTWLNYLTADDTEDTIPVGHAAWIITTESGTATFTNPYKK